MFILVKIAEVIHHIQVITTQGEFKAVLVPPPYGTGEWELFNLAVDPGEANDLSKNLPRKLQTLVAAWEKYASDVGVVPLQ